uniref:Uncharacterized protein n=1 Tax=Panagrolaimus superbus TaxID=310955 RepID=A0A914YIY7_9BILA
MMLYAKHLGECSTVASDISQKLVDTIGSESIAPNPDTPEAASQRILKAIGVDSVSASLMTMPLKDMKQTIHEACLKNELQFQCAFGFLQDQNKIAEHITAMMENDGNVKVMFENECHRPEATPSTYACIGENSDVWYNECHASINSYNNTRTEINEQMIVSYTKTLSIIQELVGRAKTESELEQITAESTTLMLQTLAGIKRIEAFKCRSYYQMERCLLKNVLRKCGMDSVNALEIILRIGYLRRERGDHLHSQFLESDISPSSACSKTFTS